jgi:hypothetical protein
MTSKKKKKSTKKRKHKPVKPVKPTAPVRKPTAPLQEYDIVLRTHERRAALQKDAQTWGTLKILKHLNQIREAQQWNPRVHDIMTKDLEFLEKAYQRERHA